MNKSRRSGYLTEINNDLPGIMILTEKGQRMLERHGSMDDFKRSLNLCKYEMKPLSRERYPKIWVVMQNGKATFSEMKRDWMNTGYVSSFEQDQLASTLPVKGVEGEVKPISITTGEKIDTGSEDLTDAVTAGIDGIPGWMLLTAAVAGIWYFTR